MMGLGTALGLGLPPRQVPSAGYVGPLDGVASKVLVAFGMVRLFSANAACVNVRESGGNTEEEIGTLSDGEFDVDAFTAHVGANNGYAETWHDQAGGNDASQGTAASQPRVDLTGINGRTALNFASGNYMVAGAAANSIGAGDWELWTLFKPASLSAYRCILGASDGRPNVYCSQGGSGKMGIYDPLEGTKEFDTTLSVGSVYLARVFSDAGAVKCELNGVLEATSHTYTQSVSGSYSLVLGSFLAVASIDPYAGQLMAAVMFKSLLTPEEAATLTARLQTLGGIS